MAYTKETYEAAKKYKNEKIKRVPLDMQKEDYDVLKAAADARDENIRFLDFVGYSYKVLPCYTDSKLVEPW